MEIKKTGKLFSFCCMVPAIIKNKNNNIINGFEKLGAEIGLLFQITDDLIDYKSSTKIAGKKTKKDQKQGKATLISLLGYKNTVKYNIKLKTQIEKKLKKFGTRAKNIKKTLDYIIDRSK